MRVSTNLTPTISRRCFHFSPVLTRCAASSSQALLKAVLRVLAPGVSITPLWKQSGRKSSRVESESESGADAQRREDEAQTLSSTVSQSSLGAPAASSAPASQHGNVERVLGVFESASGFFIITEHSPYTLRDVVLYSPGMFANPQAKRLFIIYQVRICAYVGWARRRQV